MTSKVKVIVALIAVVAVLAVGALATRIGGQSIRNNIVSGNMMVLSLSQPALRGVPVQVRWNGPSGDTDQADVVIRDSGQETLGGVALLDSGAATIVIPCDTKTPASLVLRRSGNRQVLGSAAVSLLPPGPECLK